MAGAALIAAAVVTGGYFWRAHTAPPVRVGASVSLHGGKVTFRIPSGWAHRNCPSGDSVDCFTLLAPGGDPGSVNPDPATDDPGDSIRVVVSTPDPKAPEGDPSMLLLDPTFGPVPGATYFTRDGVRFVRMHEDAHTTVIAQSANTLVMGILPNKDRITVSCTEKTVPSLVRAGCAVVLDSLHIV